MEQEQISDFGSSMNNYVDLFDENKNANAPKLTTGMVPVNYNTSTEQWEKCSVEDWDWDYIAQSGTTEHGGTSKWANAMTEDGSLWVWIPRYAYKIKSGYHSHTTGEIDVVFLVGSTNKDKDGNEYKTTYNMKEATTNGYMSEFVVHPTFGSNLKLGGWGYETPGFWVAKFEAGFAGTPGDPNSAQDSTVKYTSNQLYDFSTILDNIYGLIIPNETLMKYPIFTPGVFSYECLSIGDAYGLSKSLNSNDNPYGFTQNCSTHLIKNSEWGAVAYLAHSKYGRNKTEISINNWRPARTLNSTGQSYCSTEYHDILFADHTGYSAGSATPSANRNSGDISTTNYYNTSEGVVASSTGNVYGIFDLVGGANEYVAAYGDTRDTKGVNTYGSPQPFMDAFGSYFLQEPNNKYKELLNNNYDQVLKKDVYWITNEDVFGGAMWETSPIEPKTPSNTTTWLGDVVGYPVGDCSFICRGHNTGAGTSARNFCDKLCTRLWFKYSWISCLCN